MTNPFFNPTPITGHATARSSEVNALMEGAAAGFEMLPTPTEIKQGKINLAGADSGVVNAYVVSLPYNPTSYASGLQVRFVAGTVNSGPSTINVNSIGVAQIRNYAGAALSGGEIVAGAFTDLAYDATNGFFRIINPVTAIESVSVTNKALVSAADTTAGYLGEKIVGTGAATVSVINPGSNEDVQISVNALGLAFAAVQTGDFSATAGNIYPVDCTAASRTATLPAVTGSQGVIGFKKFGTFPLYLSGTVNGVSQTFPVTDEQTFVISDADASRGWV